MDLGRGAFLRRWGARSRGGGTASTGAKAMVRELLAGFDRDALPLESLDEAAEGAAADDSWSEDVETGDSAVEGGCRAVEGCTVAVSNDCSSVLAIPCAERGRGAKAGGDGGVEGERSVRWR